MRSKQCGKSKGSPYLARVGSLRNGTDTATLERLNNTLAVLAPSYGEERDTARRKFCKTSVSAAGRCKFWVARAQTAFEVLGIRV